MNEEFEGTASWLCARCNKELIKKKVKLNYLKKDFEHELMCCPDCGEVFIGESLALGKMLEVERSLEDK
jgi:DNA-directed RNA polymerase subunit RPC12/RpoP